MTDIFGALNAAVRCIASEQLSDGGFTSLSSPKRDNFKDAHDIRTYHTTFFAANILCCLNSVARIAKKLNWQRQLPPETELTLETIRRRATGFLLAERGPHGSFNYWARGAVTERKTMPYPDDLDDTFIALAAIHGYDSKLLGGASLANMAKILMSTEVVAGGPYRTWLVQSAPPSAWQDVDVAVNSNVGYFLSQLGIRLPHLQKLIEDAAAELKLTSPYYPDIFSVAYFAARFYKSEPYAHRIAEMLVTARAKILCNPLQTALLISAMIDLGFGEKVQMADIVPLLESQAWRPYAFCMDPARNGKKYYAGAAALTAAFVAEALAKYLEFEASQEEATAPLLLPSLGFFERVKVMARENAVALPANLKAVALSRIEATKDKEIALLPYRMYEALGRRGERVAMVAVEQLALANLYGWMAYTIYDDFLDGGGNPLYLSAANYFLREVTLQYAAFGEESLRRYKEITHVIDDANIWEQEHCRFVIKNGIAGLELPYQNSYEMTYLANRSLGHALPAIVMLDELGFAADSQDAVQFLKFLKHYLIARQLHDDAHDWKEDLLRGQVNRVAAKLIGDFQRENRGKKNMELLSFEQVIPELQQFFWRWGMESVVAEIHSHLALARKALHVIEILEDSAPLEELLDSLDRATRNTLSERALAVEFLKEYTR